MLILVQLQVEKQQHAMSSPSVQCDDFDFELLNLYFRMACLVVKKIVPLLELCKRFFTTKADNMLVVMLDPHYKWLQCFQKFIGQKNASIVVQGYDKELVLPLLMKVSQFLAPHCSCMPVEIEQIYDGSLFDVVASNEEATHALLMKEFSLF